MTTSQTILAALVAFSTWVGTKFVGHPVRKFFDLRSEIIEKLTNYANVPARYKEAAGKPGIIIETYDLSEAEMKRLEEAVSAFRDLASKMRAFAENEHFAARVVGLRYDPLRASAALIGLSNSLHSYGTDRLFQKKCLAKALRINNII